MYVDVCKCCEIAELCHRHILLEQFLDRRPILVFGSRTQRCVFGFDGEPNVHREGHMFETRCAAARRELTMWNHYDVVDDGGEGKVKRDELLILVVMLWILFCQLFRL